jgi:Ni/Fe-hydrogenase 1 B-type cytochrome subunit
MTTEALEHPTPFEEHRQDLVRIYVWQTPVRVTHWLIVLSIVVSSVTGIYIGNPFITVAGPARDHFVMGWIRTIHSYSAIVFTLSVLSRVVWMFMGNNYARWDKFIPVSRKRLRGLWGTFRFYIFNLRKPPGFVAHNPLAGLAYFAVFGLYFLMMATGFAMYAGKAPIGSPMRLFGFLVPLLGGLQTARLLHHIIMWLLLGFMVHHVYSGIYMSNVEANATMESIFSGFKFVPREDLVHSGYRFIDRQEVPDAKP